VPPMPPSGFGRWSWFYRPDYHHLVDHWAWYLAASGTPPGLATRMALAVTLPSILALIGAAWLLRSLRLTEKRAAPAAELADAARYP
jgi:hypothetical protein